MTTTVLRCVAACAAAAALALLGACGGHGAKPDDVSPFAAAPAPAAASGPDSFLLFLNQQVAVGAAPAATNTETYARAYYAAIDPGDTRDTLAKWKAANHFDQAGGEQASAVFGDFRDLGYGRRMTGRRNMADNTVAFVVENYLVNPGGTGGYGDRISLDAAVVKDERWRVSINAIEFSAGAGGNVKFAKFYSFDPVTGARRLMQDLDGRGEKALPGVCISCHGGRVDPLTATGAFPRLQNSDAGQTGDTRGRLHGFEPDALAFSTAPGFARPEQEAALKALNKMVLCTYPYSGPALRAAEDVCRPAANTAEWQALGAADLIKNAYGGAGMTALVHTQPAVPAGWAGQVDLYRNVIVPACRSCHLVRGTGVAIEPQSDIDFSTFAKFDGYAARVRTHVFERGDMPLAKIVYDRFWATPALPEQLATYLQTRVPALPPARDAAGALLAPGHPIADPGPDRLASLATATTLSAGASLFADTFRWRIVSGPDGASLVSGATLVNADTATPTFSATLAAARKRYVLELVASRGGVSSAPVQVTLHVVGAGDPDPASTNLARVTAILGNCTGCHVVGSAPPTAFAPLAADGLRSRLLGLVRFNDIAGSPLLRKPSNDHHGGNLVPAFTALDLDPNFPGTANGRDYDEVVSWILNGARP